VPLLLLSLATADACKWTVGQGTKAYTAGPAAQTQHAQKKIQIS
jgi:hypothetical protein